MGLMDKIKGLFKPAETNPVRDSSEFDNELSAIPVVPINYNHRFLKTNYVKEMPKVNFSRPRKSSKYSGYGNFVVLDTETTGIHISNEIIEISDIVTPNTAVDEGEITLNVFQHSIYLNNFNEEHGTHLTYVTEIPTAGMGIFSDKYDKLEDLPKGATIAIPNDVTNTARALRVLAQTGQIELDQSVEQATVTVDNITSNPNEYVFEEMNPEVLPNILDSVDAAIINGYFAIAADLDLSTDLYNEQVTEGYINVIAVREADKDSELTKTIDRIVHSDAFRTAIEDENKQYKSFTKPDGYYDESQFANE